MDDNNTGAAQKVEAPKKILSKAEQKIADKQAAHTEKMLKAASHVKTILCNRFFDCFLDAIDPEGPEVQEMISRVNAQWRMYCKRMNFMPVAFPHVQDYCNQIIAEYKIEKYGQKKPESNPVVDAAGANESDKAQGEVRGDAVV